MRKNHPLLRVVYILTDADESWADEMRMWLSSEGWEKVWIGRRDVYPDWEDREVGVAVDMEIARRAGVFVGNGVSASVSQDSLLMMALVFDDELKYRITKVEGRDSSGPDTILVIGHTSGMHAHGYLLPTWQSQSHV